MASGRWFMRRRAICTGCVKIARHSFMFPLGLPGWLLFELCSGKKGERHVEKSCGHSSPGARGRRVARRGGDLNVCGERHLSARVRNLEASFLFYCVFRSIQATLKLLWLLKSDFEISTLFECIFIDQRNLSAGVQTTTASFLFCCVFSINSSISWLLRLLKTRFWNCYVFRLCFNGVVYVMQLSACVRNVKAFFLFYRVFW